MTGRTKRPRASFNARLMAEDAAEKGWNQATLARLIGRDRGTITRFFSGDIQTPRVAKELADVLGQPVSRYLRRRARVAEESAA